LSESSKSPGLPKRRGFVHVGLPFWTLTLCSMPLNDLA
jgi:hypothetical protein